MMPRTVWYPGHMEKGKKRLKELASQVDVFVEVRDARAPRSSSSPLIHDLAKLKPVCVVLSKKDLAEDDKTKLWIEELSSCGMPAFAANLRSGIPGGLRGKLFGLSGHKPKWRELRVAIVGIPNVGKSMLLNALLGKRASKVGGIPGITKGVSWYRANGLLLLDSPGILDPKADRQTNMTLAWLGCLRVDVIGDYETLSMQLFEFLRSLGLMPRLLERLSIAADEEVKAEECLAALARRIGALLPGGKADFERAGRFLLESFATGKLGPFTLELPQR